jgi:hypothetical protein
LLPREYSSCLGGDILFLCVPLLDQHLHHVSMILMRGIYRLKISRGISDILPWRNEEDVTMWYLGLFSKMVPRCRRLPSGPTLNLRSPDSHSSPGFRPPQRGSTTNFVSGISSASPSFPRGSWSCSRPRLRRGRDSVSSSAGSPSSRSRFCPRESDIRSSS